MILKTIHDVSENDLQSFSCGNQELDRYLHKFALDNDRNGYGKTYLLVDGDKVVGFFTLCSASIKFEEYPEHLSKCLPRYPIPCIKIARLGVDEKEQRKGYGKELLKQAFLRILSVASQIGIKLIIVDAKETSASFYEKYGFQRLESDKLSYYLSLETLAKAI